MKIAATDEWMENLALKVSAMQLALRVVITSDLRFQHEVAFAAKGSREGLQATTFSDEQIQKIVSLLYQLATPLDAEP